MRIIYIVNMENCREKYHSIDLYSHFTIERVLFLPGIYCHAFQTKIIVYVYAVTKHVT